MNKIEIETITDAMVAKQTWIRKELKSFLQVWKKITEEPIPGHSFFTLYIYADENENDQKILLTRGADQIDQWEYSQYTDEYESYNNPYLDIDELPMWQIREIICCIHEKLADYFKNIQKDIDNLSESGQKIQNLIDKLS